MNLMEKILISHKLHKEIDQATMELDGLCYHDHCAKPRFSFTDKEGLYDHGLTFELENGELILVEDRGYKGDVAQVIKKISGFIGLKGY